MICEAAVQSQEIGVALLDCEGTEWETQGDVVDRVRLGVGGDGRVGDGDLDLWWHARGC